jgi:hypothetical protein
VDTPVQLQWRESIFRRHLIVEAIQIYFQTKYPNCIWQFLEGLRLKIVDIFYGHLEHSRTYGIFYDNLVHFVYIWHILSRFGIMHHEKFGNPEQDASSFNHFVSHHQVGIKPNFRKNPTLWKALCWSTVTRTEWFPTIRVWRPTTRLGTTSRWSTCSRQLLEGACAHFQENRQFFSAENRQFFPRKIGENCKKSNLVTRWLRDQ